MNTLSAYAQTQRRRTIVRMRQVLGLGTIQMDAQDCEDTEWFDELCNWAEQVADDAEYPPNTCHLYGCDECYKFFRYIVSDIIWSRTEEGRRYNREWKHWSWHDLISRGAPLKARTDLLQEGDRDWMVIGRQHRPASAPIP